MADSVDSAGDEPQRSKQSHWLGGAGREGASGEPETFTLDEKNHGWMDGCKWKKNVLQNTYSRDE